MNSKKKSFGRVVGAVVTGLAATALISSSASAATIPDHTSHITSVGSEGKMSINEVITNNTNQVWTLDSSQTFHLGESAHWGQRPVQELDPGQSETVTAYSPELLGINLYITYTLPNGEYVVADDVDAGIGPNGYNSAGVYKTLPDPELGPTSSADPNYTAKASAGSGWHTDSTFTLSDANPNASAS